ncbi:MAG: S9 family peptidase [Burkholderiales bacterium]|nr:S9 family peptidase [Burkholderiales bacterium]
MKEFSVEDLRLHRKVMDIHGQPGAKAVFATVRSVDSRADDYSSRIWRFPVDGGGAEAVTQGPGKDADPRLSPSGKHIAFVSDRGKSRQIYVMFLSGGEARQVGEFAEGVSAFRWAPDGKSLYVTAACPTDPDARGARAKPPAKSAHTGCEPEVAWKLPYKADGTGYLLSREIHLHNVDLEKGEAAQLTQGAFDVSGFEPSPNGRHVAYVRTREGKFAHCHDLWVCDIDGERHRRLTHDFYMVDQPSWSPDGSRIAFAGALKEGDGESRLWMITYATAEIVCVNDEMEVAIPDNLFWNAAGDELTLAQAWQGRHRIVRLPIAGGEPQVVVGGDWQVTAFAPCEAGWAYAHDVPTQASEVWIQGADAARQAGLLNEWWRDRPQLELQSRNFEVPDGKGGKETIQGWLLRKKGAQGPLPLLVDVHGGPASYVLLDYDTNVYWQAMCSRGWAILMLNAVGSSSFGSEFCSRLSGHWGEMDLPQYQAAIAALRKDGVCDGRVAIVGKSYGGYFAGWAVGHSDLFDSAVVMAPVGNVETHYGTSDGGYYADPLYIGTAPEFDRRKARQLSPLQFIEKVKTPTLFLQGKDDERCPKCQSEELFVSLYNAGDTPCELVLYPNEGHSFLGEGRPACREDAARRIMNWVSRRG